MTPVVLMQLNEQTRSHTEQRRCLWLWTVKWTTFREHARLDFVWSILKTSLRLSAPELVCWCVSASVTTMSWVPTAAVVFALVATLPLSVPVVRARPLPVPPVSSMTTSSLVFVFLWREVKGAAVSVPLPLPLSVPVSIHFDRSAGPRPRAWALPLVARSSSAAVAVAAAGLGVAIAVVAGLRLEVGKEGRGWMSPRWRAATVRARTWTRTVGPWATASAVVTVETEEKWRVNTACYTIQV